MCFFFGIRSNLFHSTKFFLAFRLLPPFSLSSFFYLLLSPSPPSPPSPSSPPGEIIVPYTPIEILLFSVQKKSEMNLKGWLVGVWDSMDPKALLFHPKAIPKRGVVQFCLQRQDTKDSSIKLVQSPSQRISISFISAY